MVGCLLFLLAGTLFYYLCARFRILCMSGTSCSKVITKKRTLIKHTSWVVYGQRQSVQTRGFPHLDTFRPVSGSLTALRYSTTSFRRQTHFEGLFPCTLDPFLKLSVFTFSLVEFIFLTGFISNSHSVPIRVMLDFRLLRF